MPKKSRSRSRSKSRKVVVPRGVSRGHALRLVYDGVYQKTRGGLTKSDITLDKYGKAVSKKKQAIGRKLQKKYGQSDEFLKYKGRVRSLSKKRKNSRR